MPIEAFLVIPKNSINPPIGETQTTDQYFAATFPGATVIQLIDFEFSVENPATIGSASTGAGAGKAKFNGLVIHKPVDKSTPALFNASVTGNHLAVVQMYVRRPGAATPAGAQDTPFLAYEFQMVYITRVDWSGSNGADLAETLSLAYGAMAIVYKPSSTDGTATQVVKEAWSQVTNTPNVQDTIALK